MIVTMNRLGEWIMLELGKRELSQADLSRGMGVSRTAISDIVSGKHNPGKGMLEKIAKFFRVPVVRVYQEAGLIPPEKRNEMIDEIIANAELLDEDGRQHLATIARALADANAKSKKKKIEVMEIT